MTYGIVIDVPAPIEMYDAVHAAVIGRTGSSIDGLLCHIGRPTEGGFQIVEVWESKEDCDRYNDQVVGPVIAELSGGREMPPGESVSEQFEVRGLIIVPRADVLR
jgi:hypothetical protein